MKLFYKSIKKTVLSVVLVIPLVGLSQPPSYMLFDLCEFDIRHVGFNTKASDFGPSFVGDSLWFSAYDDQQIKKIEKGRTDDVYYSIFETPVDSKGITTYEPRVKVTRFNSGFHEGPVSYCNHTGELFVTLSNPFDADVEENGVVVKKQKIRLRIVIYSRFNGRWVLKEEFPFNNKVYSVGHPSVSSTGDTLFFTSDDPALSQGGTDIFMSIRKNGKWGEPMKLGENINTKGTEMFPFYDPSGMLIFASNGRHGGKGGLDLYCSDLTPNGFAPAIPLDMFNTKYDDFGLIIHPSGESGYFVSNRPGQDGDDDIYLVKINKTYTLLRGSVVDAVTGDAIKNADVTLFSCSGRKTDNTTADPNGDFVFKALRGKCYMVGAEYTNYPENRISYGKDNVVKIGLKLNRSLEINAYDYDTGKPVRNVRVEVNGSLEGYTSGSGTLKKNLSDEKAMTCYITKAGYLNRRLKLELPYAPQINPKIPMIKLSVSESFFLGRVKFAYDSWNLTPETVAALDDFVSLLKENPAIKVEVALYTGESGTKSYKQNLSQKRAGAIQSYILGKGIPREKIATVGYAQKPPSNKHYGAANTSVDGSDNQVEVKITGFMK